MAHTHTKGECERFSAVAEGRATLAAVETLRDAGILETAPLLPEALLPSPPSADTDRLADADLLALRNDQDQLTRDQKAYHYGTLFMLMDGYQAFKQRPRWKEGWRHRDAYARLLATHLRSGESPIDAAPIVSSAALPSPLAKIDRVSAVQVLLRAVPSANRATPWEAVLDFRSDEENRLRYRKLRGWLADATRDGSTVAEFEDRMGGLLVDLETSVRLHHKKLNIGSIELLLRTSATVLQDLLRFQLGSAVSLLIELISRRPRVLEAELSNPGSELAYLLQARRFLSSDLHG